MYIDVAINFLLFQKATFMSDIKVSSKVKFLKWHGLFRRKYSGFEYKLENYQLLSRKGKIKYTPRHNNLFAPFQEN